MTRQSKLIIPLQFFLVLFFSLNISSTTSAKGIPADAKTYYVLAPSGLNLRQAADTKSKKIGFIPYGEKVTLVKPSLDMSLKVDKISGGMAKVSYKGTIGFAFDGYLSLFPSPKDLNEVEHYVERGRKAGIEVLYEECRRDYDGYFQFESSFTLPGQNWAHAFLIGQQLHKVPKAFNLPPTTAPKDTDLTIPNPVKNENAWTDELYVEYDDNGQIALVQYAYRAEATGQTITWEFVDNFNAIKITGLAIAD